MSNAGRGAAGMTPLPQTVTHSSQRLTHREAHSMLSTFLEKAEVDAAYRPDSTLTERGPQSSTTGPNSNLTLYHLNRILQGIEGKHLGPDPNISRFFGDGTKSTNKKPDSSLGGDGTNDTPTLSSSPPASRKTFDDQQYSDGEDGVGVGVSREADGWQDKEDYELAQREGGLKLLDDDKQPASRREAEDVTAVDLRPDKQGGKGKGDGVVDKNARREAKKRRGKAEQKERGDARKQARKKA